MKATDGDDVYQVKTKKVVKKVEINPKANTNQIAPFNDDEIPTDEAMKTLEPNPKKIE